MDAGDMKQKNVLELAGVTVPTPWGWETTCGEAGLHDLNLF